MRTKVVKVKGANVKVRIEVEKAFGGSSTLWRVWDEKRTGVYGHGVACHWATANARAKRCIEELECDWACANRKVPQ